MNGNQLHAPYAQINTLGQVEVAVTILRPSRISTKDVFTKSSTTAVTVINPYEIIR